jgi:hypothetical protein
MARQRGHVVGVHASNPAARLRTVIPARNLFCLRLLMAGSQPTKLELSINLETAKALGLHRADHAQQP